MARAATGVEPTEPATPAESWRLRAVQVAWSLIRKHPNWYRNYGFAVEVDGWTSFLASMRDLRDQVQARLQREMEWQHCEERPSDIDTLEAIVVAVHLLQAGRRPAWPLPAGAVSTWEAMSFLFVEAFGSAPPTTVTEVVDAAPSVRDWEAWSVELCGPALRYLN